MQTISKQWNAELNAGILYFYLNLVMKNIIIEKEIRNSWEWNDLKINIKYTKRVLIYILKIIGLVVW